MTDIDKLKELLDSFGVPHRHYEDTAADDGEKEFAQVVKVGGYTHQSDPRDTVTGYRGFFTLYNFDADGKFVCMGAWE